MEVGCGVASEWHLRWSGAGVGLGMLRGAGDFQVSKLPILKLAIVKLSNSEIHVFRFSKFLIFQNVKFIVSYAQLSKSHLSLFM